MTGPTGAAWYRASHRAIAPGSRPSLRVNRDPTAPTTQWARPSPSRSRSWYTGSIPVQSARGSSPTTWGGASRRSTRAWRRRPGRGGSRPRGMDAGLADLLPGVFQGVDDAGMAAAGDDHQALLGVEHQGHVLGHVVLDLPSVRVSDRALEAPVPLGIGAQDRAGQPGARV